MNRFVFLSEPTAASLTLGLQSEQSVIHQWCGSAVCILDSLQSDERVPWGPWIIQHSGQRGRRGSFRAHDDLYSYSHFHRHSPMFLSIRCSLRVLIAKYSRQDRVHFPEGPSPGHHFPLSLSLCGSSDWLNGLALAWRQHGGIYLCCAPPRPHTHTHSPAHFPYISPLIPVNVLPPWGHWPIPDYTNLHIHTHSLN